MQALLCVSYRIFVASLQSADYLLVTATPFSLYLQPDHYGDSEVGDLAPTRPAFTHLVPVHDKYIEGISFSNLTDDDSESIFYDIQEEITQEELSNLKDPFSISLIQKDLLKVLMVRGSRS